MVGLGGVNDLVTAQLRKIIRIYMVEAPFSLDFRILSLLLIFLANLFLFKNFLYTVHSLTLQTGT